ncbi:FeS cluster assembly protein SufD, putative [Plasmodium vivax]|uniref:FeS cluster assembly protein SufD, putative n=1 Tax=Plasmodium vivax TaxID=5855 RepID=A0A564ZUK5_PLAVI|nr:FeS cluster assembly protein SufD, putative [Plasmodium vivax]
MPKAIKRSYVLVLLLLTSNVVNIFHYAECKRFDDAHVTTASFRTEVKPHGSAKLKPQYYNCSFSNVPKRGRSALYGTGHEWNKNKVKRKVYAIHFDSSFAKRSKRSSSKETAGGGQNGANTNRIRNAQNERIAQNGTEEGGHKNREVPKLRRGLTQSGGTPVPQFSKPLFINLSTSKEHTNKRRNFKKKLRKYEELYEKFTPEMEKEEDGEEEITENCQRNVSNVTMNDWYLGNDENKYKKTLMYDYLSNMHNTEYQDIGSVNNFIKNNELIERDEWEKKKKPYLTYTYNFMYTHPVDLKRDFYTYKFYIPKLVTYEEDISTESKFVPSNFNSPKCYNNSPINALTTSGFSARNIDTFGKERNKIYSFNTPTDVKRNVFFNDLMLISSSYNQHFFPNLNFLLNLHTLQILIRDKTAIETDYLINKFDQLKEKLILRDGKNSNEEESSPKGNTPPTVDYEKKATNHTSVAIPESELQMKRSSSAQEGIPSLVDPRKSTANQLVKKQNDPMDEEISRSLTHKKNLFDDQIQIFKEKYNQNILEDTEFINLWKYDEKGEIIENSNGIPIPKIYLNIDDPKYCMWKILQNSGKSAFGEVPTPNRKLEAWRQQVNLKKFYKQNFDNSISLRKISKEELANFKMKIDEEAFRSGKSAHQEDPHGKEADVADLEQAEFPLDGKPFANPDKQICSEADASDQSSAEISNPTGDDKKIRDNPPMGINSHKTSSPKKLNENVNYANSVKCKNAFYTLVVRDGIVDEHLSDDIAILKKLDNELKQSDAKNVGEQNPLEPPSSVNPEEQTKKSKIFVGSFFNIKDAEVEYLINKELYFIPEHSNWYKKNTQPFVRGQIGKQSRKFDNDYPIYDYRKSDFGMAKFSALNLASIKDCAVIYLDKDIDLSDKFIHVIFIATSKNEDDQASSKEADYSVCESLPGGESVQGTNESTPREQPNKYANDGEETHHASHKDKENTEPIQQSEKKYTQKELTNCMHNPVTTPRLVVYVKGNSKINIHESHISLSQNNGGLVNAFSRITMEEKSTVKHTLSQELGKNVWYFHNVSVKNGFKANYKFADVLLGSLSSRVNIQIEGEKGCKQESYGLSLLEDKQNISQYEMFHHEHPNMETNQLFKFLVSDKGHAVWRSRGRIERDAIKAKLNTLCRSVLLNFGASAVAIPTLEIIPSDIECANHGATISDLEEEPIFSLMTRGITERVARQMMMKAFVNEILEHIPDENLRERVHKKVLQLSLKYRKTIPPDLEGPKK